MDRAFEQESSVLRRSAQAVEQAAEKLERTVEELGSLKTSEGAGRDEALDERLTAFEEGLADTLGDLTVDLFSDLKIGLDDFFSGFFSRFITSRLGLFGDLVELFLPFAEGGFVKSPTLALLGERGPEYVVPEAGMRRALEGGLVGLAGLLADIRGGAPPFNGEMGASIGSTVLTVQHIHNAPVIGSLDRLDEYNQQAGAGVTGGDY